MRRHAWGLLLAGALLLIPQVALAKSLDLPEADVTLDIQTDGTVQVTERITYTFDGAYSGAYREIPVRSGERIAGIAVSDAVHGDYAPGACTDLGCSSPAGTFGVRDLGGRTRVVWHYSAVDTSRTFTVTYLVTGLAIAYDDIVDVNWKVWGDEWPVRLGHLTATASLPPGAQPDDVRVWGHPATVDGETALGDSRIEPSLEARDIPAGRWVEMRVTFPRSLLTSTAGAQVVPGDGLGDILAEEVRFVEQQQNEAGRLRGLVIGGLLGGTIPALVAAFLFYRRFGKEPVVEYDREYEQEPPSELTPAEVSALVSQGQVTERDFVATLFDLIRRGHIDSQPTTYEKSTWMGLKNESITDLELSLGTGSGTLAPHEQQVMVIMRRVLADGPSTINELRDRIQDDAAQSARTYQQFRSDTTERLSDAGLLDLAGRTNLAWVLVPGFALLAIVFGVTLASSFDGRGDGRGDDRRQPLAVRPVGRTTDRARETNPIRCTGIRTVERVRQVSE